MPDTGSNENKRKTIKKIVGWLAEFSNGKINVCPACWNANGQVNEMMNGSHFVGSGSQDRIQLKFNEKVTVG